MDLPFILMWRGHSCPRKTHLHHHHPRRDSRPRLSSRAKLGSKVIAPTATKNRNFPFLPSIAKSLIASVILSERRFCVSEGPERGTACNRRQAIAIKREPNNSLLTAASRPSFL